MQGLWSLSLSSLSPSSELQYQMSYESCYQACRREWDPEKRGMSWPHIAGCVAKENCAPWCCVTCLEVFRKKRRREITGTLRHLWSYSHFHPFISPVYIIVFDSCGPDGIELQTMWKCMHSCRIVTWFKELQWVLLPDVTGQLEDINLQIYLWTAGIEPEDIYSEGYNSIIIWIGFWFCGNSWSHHDRSARDLRH